MSPRPRSTTAASEAAEPSFEQSIEELDQIIQSLDGDAQGLEALVARYERGMKLLGRCQQQLDAAQLRIEQISRRAEGGPEAAPAAPPSPLPPLPPVASDDEIRLF